MVETNLYATTRDVLGKTMDGKNWKEFIASNFRAFVAMAIYIGMKKQPYYRTYWMKKSFFLLSQNYKYFFEAMIYRLEKMLLHYK